MESKQGCYTCERMARPDVPVWDRILRTQHWTLVHSYNTALPGWLVLVANRHLDTVAEMSEAEASELGLLQRAVSLALQQVTGCVKTYIAQFAEAPQHRHVHFHIIPRYVDQPEELRGPRIFSMVGVPETQRVTDAAMTELAAKIRPIVVASAGGQLRIEPQAYD